MLKQSLEDANKNGEKDLADEKATKKAAEEEKATDEKDLQMTVKALTDAETKLADTKASCMGIAADHEASVASRNEELKMIAEAKKVLTETSSGAVGQTYSLLQVSENSKMKTRADLKRAEVLSKVKNLAKHFHSSALAQLASRIEAAVKLGTQAGADPFAKVKGLIEDLIAKLEKEASDAAAEKAFCDDQMAKTEEKKSELEEDLAALTAKMDKAAATSATLKDDVATLQKELAELAKTQAEMDKIRADENAAFKVAKEELTLGLTGVRQALTILRDYYASKAAALVQTGQPEPPVMHSKAEGAGGSIIGILEVVESDFAKNLAQRTQEEADEQAEYEKITQENAVTKTEKEQAVKYKTQEFKSLDKALADMAGDKETMSTELKAVLEYYAKIKDRCIAKPETYEERKRRREAEIAGLKEALSILESETALVQLRSGRHRRSGLQQH
jgi:cell division protein FtsB